MLWPPGRRFEQDATMPAFRTAAALGLALTALCLGGCREDARGLVAAMGRVYRAADRYADDARVRIVRTSGDATTEEMHPFRVAFSRPDRMRIEAYDPDGAVPARKQ